MVEEDEVFKMRREDYEDEDTMHNVQDLINRYRGGSPATKRKTRSDSNDELGNNTKSARKDNHQNHPMSGKFVMRAASKEDPLHFIHQLLRSKLAEQEHGENYDAETEELLSIIRGAPTNDGDDLDSHHQSRLRSLLTSALIKQFERPGDGQDEVDAGGHGGRHEVNAGGRQEVMSSKEQRNKQAQEKDVDEENGEKQEDVEEVEEVEEVLADNLNQHKGDSDSPSSSSKHSGEVSSADLDFACVQSGSQLNVDANKQRAQLRQKGTLAGRRKPTRSSLRADLAEQVMVSPDDDDVQEEPMRASSSSPLEAMESRRAPILLPGLGEMANKSKLRPTRPPKPSVGDSPTSSPSSSSSPPPWLVEAKQRRASRQPKGEAEKMSKESEPEKPAWMKDALAKQQKRASITSTQSQQSQQSDGPSTPPPTANEDPSTTTVTTAAPWLQERNLRKSRLQPTTHTNTSPVVEPVPPAKPSMNSTAPAANTIIINRSNPAESRVEQDENQPPAQKYPVLRPTPIIPTSARLSSSFSTDDEPAENTPTPVWRAEINERKKSKSYIHPLRLEQPMKLGETPAWKKELAEKRKSRRSSSTPSGTSADGGGGQSTVAADTIVQSSTHHDGDSTAENGVMSSSVPESEETEILPPWKLELERRKKRGSTGGGGGGGGGNRDSTPSPAMQSSAPAEDDVPEWIKAVEKRRSRLASAGYKT